MSTMRCAFALILLAIPLCGAEMKIDHATIAGAKLADMRAAFTAATGIPTEYGGPHSNHATEMALASFPDGSYVELMAIQEHADPAAVAAHVWGQFLKADAGPCAFALRSTDVSAEIQRLSRAGVGVSGVEKSGRTRPDGVVLSWETANVGSGPRGSVLPFLIRDFTPRENRVYPSGKPTSKRFGGVGLVVVGVRSLAESIAQYRTAFQLPEPKRQRDQAFGANLAWFEGTPVVLAEPLTPDSWLARRVALYGNSPAALILTTASAIAGWKPSDWFGNSLFWNDDSRFGWRLGAWTIP